MKEIWTQYVYNLICLLPFTWKSVFNIGSKFYNGMMLFYKRIYSEAGKAKYSERN